ncbi:uncharacterized protein EHS24_009214 [Apiotrichum porosum]|uniref:Uncharacterized protein n=1 Tax=Apiotrichum porosum TaxID=105984 RepID=A0A427XP46_9TREE|nr:uncharacterized protein EHS24_009214 [Apiotrichum porosum]RSH80630.1 hypothetical protein EHS24_009214 [Apiotrichum porosum]
MPRSKAHSDPRGSDDDAAPDAKRRAVPDSTTGAPATTTGSKRWTNADCVVEPYIRTALETKPTTTRGEPKPAKTKTKHTVSKSPKAKLKRELKSEAEGEGEGEGEGEVGD